MHVIQLRLLDFTDHLDAIQHHAQDIRRKSSGREPDGTVRNTRWLGLQVENVATVSNRFGTENINKIMSTLYLFIAPDIRSEMGRRSCSFAAPAIWNSIPRHICFLDLLSTFRGSVKTYYHIKSLFRHSYQ